MSEFDLVEQSELLYRALIVARTESAVEKFRVSGKFPEEFRETVRRCKELLKKGAHGQELVESRTGHIVPDLDSVLLYQDVLEAWTGEDFLPPESDISQVTAKLVETLDEILSGKSIQDIGEASLLHLQQAIHRLVQVYTDKTTVSRLGQYASSLPPWRDPWNS